MKYLKFFKISTIDSICDKYEIKNHVINSDGSVDVYGDVNISHYGLTKIPLKFGKVSGDFKCNHNWISILKGCPNSVGGGFNCSGNRLSSLEGAPIFVGKYFFCYNNILDSFEGFQGNVDGFNIKDNPVHEIWKLFKDINKIELFNYYDIIRDKSIVLDRLNDFLEVIGKPTVEKVRGYKNI